MKLVNHDNPIITTVSNEFDFINPPFDPIDFSKELIKHMYEWNGIGLAAVQVGVPYRIFAMRGTPENFVCFNPKIVHSSDDVISLEEGCLTYPGLIVKIKRPQHIRVRFNTPNGDILTKQFTGMTARIFQHEMMHIEGKTFKDYCSKLILERSCKKANKKGFNYSISTFY
jgi:peptide deformylase